MSFKRNACLFLLLAASAAAFARVFDVNTTTDAPAVDLTSGESSEPGAVSLRSAIQAANNDPSTVDTINVPAGIYDLSVAGRDENDCATGDLDILGPLTIVGAGPGLTIIDAKGIDKVFSINPLWTSSFATSLSGLTIRGGHNTSSITGDGYGGAMDWDAAYANGSLTIANCVITGSTCDEGPGGAIALTGSSAGTVTLLNTTISNCSALADQGGGIWSGYGIQTTLLNCSVTGNQSGTPGGASGYGAGVVGIDTGVLTIHGCTIANNISWGTDSQGGGIDSYCQAIIDQGTVISNNSCGRQGGGVYLSTFALGSSITNSTITGNSAGSAGGGIYVSCGDVSMNFCRVANNSAPTAANAYKDANPATAGTNPPAGALRAANCWWGSNAGPGTSAVGVAPASLTSNPWLTLEVSAVPSEVERNAAAALTASLNKNSAGVTVGGTGSDFVPDSTSSSWSLTGPGNLSPATSSFSNGNASATFTAGAEIAESSVTVTVDGQTATTPLIKTIPVTLSSLSIE